MPDNDARCPVLINFSLDIFGTEYVSVVDSRDYHEAGNTIEVAFNMNKAHFFDKETDAVIK